MTTLSSSFRILASIIIIINVKLCESNCRSFTNVLVGLKDRYGFEYNATVNGCIQRIQFDNRTIVEANIKNQKIPKLDVDSVRNMGRLEKLSFVECNLKSVVPTAFRNVPRLKRIQISFCNLTELLTGTFSAVENLEILKLDHNQLTVIEPQALGNLSVLRRLYVNNNNLTEWRRDWFDVYSRLETVDFQRNKIRTIPIRAFSKMKKLKQINFDYNEIETIGPAAFEDLTDLDQLRLKHNRLKIIKSDAFPIPIRIRYLVISANYLNFLSNELLKKLSVGDMLIDFNPWKCSCMEEIHYWMHTTNVTLTKANHCDISSVPVCASPKSSSQACLEYVDDELTDRYLDILRNLSSPLKEWCAQLD